MTHPLRIFRLDPRARLPAPALPNAVGLDVYAFLIAENNRETKMQIPPNGTRAVPTKICAIAPPGTYLQVCSRSGLAVRSIYVANSPGIVDPDYTGEILILLHNGGPQTHWVQHEDRIAQLIIAPLLRTHIEEISEEHMANIDTERGSRGFGSTGR